MTEKTMLERAPEVKTFIDRLIDDPHRPGYHFAIPEGRGLPFDPNAAFYRDGIYHLMYLYHHPAKGHCWGHVSSHDLVHWRRHRDCLETGPHARGCYSGGVLIDDDGMAYIVFWDYVSDDADHGGIRLAASEPPYDVWTVRPDYIVRCDRSMGVASHIRPDGRREILAAADPSNLWKENGVYYFQCGNLCALSQFGRAKDSDPRLRGDWTDLYCSEDLAHWRYLHRFYQRDAQNRWTAESEDDMCPSFLPLASSAAGGPPSGQYLQLFISHDRGCQYYIGDYDKERAKFLPRSHGRMSWADDYFFAPEALVDGRGRQIMWAWLHDDPCDPTHAGWCGVYCLPRVLWLAGDGSLGIAPAQELRQLRLSPLAIAPETLRHGDLLRGINGLSCEIELVARVSGGGRIGFQVRVSSDLGEYAEIYYDGGRDVLTMDTRMSARECCPALERAPFALREGELLRMRIFVDKSVLEVFANDRQAVCRRFLAGKGGRDVRLICEGCAAVESLTIWELAPANPY